MFFFPTFKHVLKSIRSYSLQISVGKTIKSHQKRAGTRVESKHWILSAGSTANTLWTGDSRCIWSVTARVHQGFDTTRGASPMAMIGIFQSNPVLVMCVYKNEFSSAISISINIVCTSICIVKYVMWNYLSVSYKLHDVSATENIKKSIIYWFFFGPFLFKEEEFLGLLVCGWCCPSELSL